MDIAEAMPCAAQMGKMSIKQGFVLTKSAVFWASGALGGLAFHLAKNVALQYDDLIKISLFLIRIW
ncbi:MAG: hypothetical protein PHX60_10045 [Giesbergeria sp.]|uniref:hypothetical protein n=1 Tax=Giesbergeria sp. TaxID=2818473 RepID=UPI00262DF0A0|nr:hypothetical protein [Giesbergeria sp.]MDD2610019.1 hypothetical protein [Giesbergeria sp.]